MLRATSNTLCGIGLLCAVVFPLGAIGHGSQQIADGNCGSGIAGVTPPPHEPLIPVRDLVFSPDGKYFGVGNCAIYDTATGKLFRKLPTGRPGSPEGFIYSSFAWSPDGKHYVAGVDATHGKMWGKVRVWSHKTGKPVA